MLLQRIKNKVSLFFTRQKIKRNIRFLGRNVYVKNFYWIKGKNLSIYDNVYIGDQCWLSANPLTGESESILIINKGCNIGRFNEIYATKEIILEDNVLTAERVYISDNIHGYRHIDLPIIKQPIVQKDTVRIGAGSWLGVGVAVIGANIGKHCVIGANAVVTHDIPDYSVAVGIPAKVIKRYNFSTKRWEKTNPDGSFIENK